MMKADDQQKLYELLEKYEMPDILFAMAALLHELQNKEKNDGNNTNN